MFALLNSRITFSASADTESKATTPTAQPLTVLQFVEAFNDPEVAALKVRTNFALIPTTLIDKLQPGDRGVSSIADESLSLNSWTQ